MRGGLQSDIGPGNAEGSRLYQRLVGSRFGLQMPPTGPLAHEEIGVIKEWIDQGAIGTLKEIQSLPKFIKEQGAHALIQIADLEKGA